MNHASRNAPNGVPPKAAHRTGDPASTPMETSDQYVSDKMVDDLITDALDHSLVTQPALAQASAENTILQKHLTREVEIATSVSAKLVHAEREAVAFHRTAGRIWDESSQWADTQAASAAASIKVLREQKKTHPTQRVQCGIR